MTFQLCGIRWLSIPTGSLLQLRLWRLHLLRLLLEWLLATIRTKPMLLLLLCLLLISGHVTLLLLEGPLLLLLKSLLLLRCKLGIIALLITLLWHVAITVALLHGCGSLTLKQGGARSSCT